MKATHYLINARFAKANNLPASFVALKLKETQKAIWVYGHGAMDPTGHCARCSRTLTHPGSILIGIGPECLGDWGARDYVLDNMTEKDKLYLKSLITNRRVDTWIPKTCIKNTMDSDIEINIPENHKSIAPKVGDIPTTSNRAVEGHSTKQAREWRGKIAIQFPYSYETLQKVKSLEGRKWVPDGKYWTADLKVFSIRKLHEWGFELDVALKGMLTEAKAEQSATKTETKIDFPNIGLKRELFPYQKEGVQFVESRKGRALIADEMGLGKTIQALAYLQLHPEHRPAVILCPASLKLNWAKEIVMTMTKGIKTQILEGKETYKITGQIVIINYDILRHWVRELKMFKPQIIIADECHYFKSNTAKRTKAVKDLAKFVPNFIALSGTPIVNRPIEIYNALSIINSSVIPGFWDYAKTYCDAKHNGFGWDFSGATNTDELHRILTESIMIRRKKADVLKDLPDKIYSHVPMTLSNIQEYGQIEQDVIGYLKRTKGQKAADKASNAEYIVQIELLKQAAVRGKMDAVIDWIKNFLETDEKLIVFATHKFVIDRLMQEFPQISVKIDGSCSQKEKQEAKEKFQNDPKTKLIFGNIQAMGVGHTLTAASNVAFLEFPWTPGELQQAEDRAHRIGQKFTVNVYMLLAAGTIDEDIAALLDRKRKVLDAVLDGEKTSEKSLLMELIGKLKDKGNLKDNKTLQNNAINDALKMFNS